MYNERPNFSMKNVIFQFLFVALFIFILIWLFPMKSDVRNAFKGDSNDKTNNVSSVLYDRIFNENVIAMKDAAKSYFTTPRLPQNVGDKVKMTLGEMLNKKIILPFVDKNGDACDLDASYVEITKYDEEFVMKVNLKCGSEENYLLVYMGCYDYCSTAICEKNQSDIKTPVIYSGETKEPIINITNNNTNNNTVVVNPDPKPTPTSPSCSLMVTSGTLSGSNYVGPITIGFETKNSGAGATLSGFGLGTSENYNGDTSYRLTKPGTYIVMGYVKNSFGNAATCSKQVTIIEEQTDKPKEYEYQYMKSISTNGYYKESNWSDWSTNVVSANANTAVKTKTVTSKKLIGYNVKKGPDYSKPIYGTKDIVVGQKTQNVCTKFEHVPTGEYSYSEWVYVDTIPSNQSLAQTETDLYVLDSDRDYYCKENCTAGTTHYYKHYRRTKTPITEYKCTKTETKSVDIVEQIPIVVGYEQKIISQEPVYKTTETKYYSYKTRTFIPGTTSVDYKWSNSSNDKSLINAGYTYTGVRREK